MSLGAMSHRTAQGANAERWSASDEAWRGYRHVDGRLLLESRVHRALDLVLPVPGGSLLDIGCATGIITELLARRAGVRRAIGVDFTALDGPVETRAVNLDSSAPLPFDDGSFDVVTCLETLEHVHDTDHLVGEIRRVLRKDGYAIVSVPRIDGALTVAMLAIGYQPPAIECSLLHRYGTPEAGARVSGHVSHFTRRALEELLVQHGFALDAFAQAGIYSGWVLAAVRPPPLWKRVPLWLASHVPVRQDVQIHRVRPTR